MRRPRAILIAVAGAALAALLLRYGVGVAGGWADGHGPVAGELIFVMTIFGAMLVLAITLGRVGGVNPLAAGGAPTTAVLRGGALGAAGLLLAVGYCALAGTLGGNSTLAAPSGLIAGTVAITLQVVAEEALFRGVLQPLVIRSAGRVAGIAIVAVAFAGLHGLAGGAGTLPLVNMALGGLLFGCLALRGRGIAGAVGAHLAWNGGEQLCLGLDPNPGVGSFGAIVDLELAGPPLWGGSESGLNASLAMTLALAAVLAFLLVRLWRERTATDASSRLISLPV